LGICLGAQLLLSKGFEFGEHEGLGFMPGEVVHFPPLKGEKTPHMGWNVIEPPAGKTWKGTILENVPPGSEMYFIHSYILQAQNPEHVLAETTYGSFRFPTVIAKGHIVGCQFHPEKSGEVGLRILERFVGLAR